MYTHKVKRFRKYTDHTLEPENLSNEEYIEIFKDTRYIEFGVICKKCNCDIQYWKKDKKVFQCKKCSYRTSLKSGTIMHNSKAAIKTWYFVTYYFKQGLNALEIKEKLNYNRYETVYNIVKKLKRISAIDINFNISNPKYGDL
jgi:hypothetical protein